MEDLARLKMVRKIAGEIIDMWDAGNDPQVRIAVNDSTGRGWAYIGECMARLAIHAVSEIERGFDAEIENDRRPL